MEQARGMMDSATSEREREAIRRFMACLLYTSRLTPSLRA